MCRTMSNVATYPDFALEQDACAHLLVAGICNKGQILLDEAGDAWIHLHQDLVRIASTKVI